MGKRVEMHEVRVGLHCSHCVEHRLGLVQYSTVQSSTVCAPGNDQVTTETDEVPAPAPEVHVRTRSNSGMALHNAENNDALQTVRCSNSVDFGSSPKPTVPKTRSSCS